MSADGIVIPVILCGGSGTRLWPVSRENYPKQFLNFFSDFSLLQETARRALRVIGAGPEILVAVTSEEFEEDTRTHLAELGPSTARHILAEPCARDTAAAIALASVYVKNTFGGDSLMWILPSDHHIGNEIALSSAFRAGLAAAKDNYIVTFGIRPTRPETGYGYIRAGDSLKADSARSVEIFIEKPDLATAEKFVNSGDYLWNSGIFLFSANHVLNEFRQHAPHILKGITSPELYAALPRQSFDKAIMEKSSCIAVVPCAVSWSDVGSWESLWQINDKDKNGNVIQGRAACHKTKNCLVKGKDRLIALAGLENIVVIETDDAILIADRNNSESLKGLVKGLEKSGAPEIMGPVKKPSAQKRNKIARNY